MIRSYDIPFIEHTPVSVPDTMEVALYTWLHTEQRSGTPDFSFPVGLVNGKYTLYGVRHHVESRMRQLGTPWIWLRIVFTGYTAGEVSGADIALHDCVCYCNPKDEMGLIETLTANNHTDREFFCDFADGYAFMQYCNGSAMGNANVNPVSVRAEVSSVTDDEVIIVDYPLTRETNNAVDTFSKPLAGILTDANIDVEDRDMYDISLTMLTGAGGSGQMGSGTNIPLFTHTYHSARARQALNVWYKDTLNRWQYLWLPCSLYNEITRKEETALLMEGNRLPYNITSEKIFHADTDLINLTQAKQIEEMMRSHDIRVNLSSTPLPPTAAYPTGISDGTSAALPGTLTTTPTIAQHRLLIREQECVSYRAGIKPAFKLSFNISPL